jgi:hypothetical protein
VRQPINRLIYIKFIGLVQQPGWLSHKSCNFSPCGYDMAVFLAVVVQKLKFLNNSIKNPAPENRLGGSAGGVSAFQHEARS